jgi:hypothetical protein
VRKLGVENKCKNVERGTRDDRIFPCGIEKLTPPLVHVGALTKSIAPPQVTKTQLLTKSTRSPSLERWVSNRVHKAFLRLPQSQELTKNPQSTKTV